MTPYGRHLLIGFIVGPMILLGIFAWMMVTMPASSAGKLATDVEEQATSTATDPADNVISSAAAATVEPASNNTGSRLRPLPRAEGLPAVAEDVAKPVGIRIPDVAVDGDVVAVGVEADGSFEVPSAREVGWYRHGSNVGESGSTVLAAHISYNGVNGVFRHLASISPGAVVEVVMADGAVFAYRVVEVVEYDKLELPVDRLFSESGGDRLALITCGGTFNPRLRSYESNVVAYAEPVAG